MYSDNNMAVPGSLCPINNQQVSITHDGLHAVTFKSEKEGCSRVLDELVQIQLPVNIIFGRRREACRHAGEGKRPGQESERCISGDE